MVGRQLGTMHEPPPTAIDLVLASSGQPMDMANLLRASLAANGLDAHVRDTGFDQWRFVLREPQAPVSTGSARLIFCLLDATIVYPRMAIDTDMERLARTLASVGDEIEGALRHTEATGGFIIFNTVPVPATQMDALIDFRARAHAARLWHEFNARLLGLVDTFAHVQVLEANHVLQGRLEEGRFWDPRMATAAGVQWTPDAMRAFADACARTAHAVLGRARKCLVLDLDNTLWGGVLGDDGIDGIEIDEGSRGNAFARLQQTAAALGRQGVILAINSKNDSDLVDQCFAQRSMPLTRDDFAMVVANWDPKPGNLRHIVKTLNIHEDSVVFVDDSPFECALVRESLPAVRVVDIGDEPARAVERLLGNGMFDRVSVTADDRNRNRSYAIEARRAELRTGTSDYDDYLRRLALTVSLRPVTSRNIQRAAQLSQRTNQFNLCGRRFTETELGQRLAAGECMDLLFSVRDRFGDYGIVGAVYTHLDGPTLHIDNMVLSCRVFSRGIEQWMLAQVVDRAHQRECQMVQGHFIETPRNHQFRRFYSEGGFETTAGDAPGEWFTLPIPSPDARRPRAPEWITRLD